MERGRGAVPVHRVPGRSGSLPCLINPAVDSCAYFNITTTTSGRTLTLNPSAGRYDWYLVTARDVSGEGTSGVGAHGPRQQNEDGACGSTCAPLGASCSSGAGCCSSNCLAGRCVVACCKTTGAVGCASNVECAGGTCSGGTCFPACSCPNHDLASVDLLTPGVFDPFTDGPVVSRDAAGAFWVLGAGDPAPGSGIDSGLFPAGGCNDSNGCWIYSPSDPEVPDPGTRIDSDWTDARIDGCVDALPGQRCMAAMLGDQWNSVGYFTLLTAADGAADGFTFGATLPHVELAPLPRPSITGQSDTGGRLKIDAGLEPVPGSGIVPDPACRGTLLLGYKLYRQVVGPGGPPPGSRRREEWELARGGSGPGGQPLPIGAATAITATGCVSQGQVYLAATLVFESGFEVPFVSASAAPVPCGTCSSVDGDGDGFRGDKCAASSLFDCDDASPTVYPGAPQICDGLANDCDDPGWPSLDGTNEQDADGDGVSECGGDPCPHDRNDDCDQDGLCGDVDNCPERENPGQQDADQDGVGDACDPCPASSYDDDDDDGICGDLDNCPLVRNPSQSNADQDALGDVCDACPHDAENDADHDGLCGDVDPCPHDAENDADGDGICGDVDPCPHEPGTGCGRFGPPNLVAGSLISITSISAADLDRDGDLDLVATVGISSSNSNKVLWFENALGDGSAWSAHQVSTTEYVTRSATVADLDRDGDLDILFSSARRVVWFENAGNGSGWTTHVIQPSSDARMVAAGDLDGDGDLDVVATDSGDRVLWSENLDGRGASWASRTLATFHDDPQALALADVDGDQDLDVFVTGGTRFFGERRLALYVNLGHGASWQQRTLELGPSYTFLSIAAADLDRDTDVDLVVGADGGGLPGQAYWQENLAGSGTAWSAHVIHTSSSLQYRSVFPADLDGDGDLDVLVGRAFPPSFTWQENVGGNGSVWAFHWIAENSPSPVQLLAVDLDGDSDLDAVAATQSSTILWFENRL